MKIAELIVQLHVEHPDWPHRSIADEVRRLRPGARTTADSVANTLSNSRSERQWPLWPEPSLHTLATVARSATPLMRFLHPDVVEAVADDNRRGSCEWSSRLAALGIDPSAYLWDGSACTFPGIRRSSGKKDDGSDCLKLDPDGNAYPKHIWAFTLTGGSFRNEGPKGYHLAHLFDHKASRGRFRNESAVAGAGGTVPKLHGLFTSAANVAFVPEAFESLTDFAHPIRHLLLRQAERLYGDVCRLLPPNLNAKGDGDPDWTPDAFDWAQPEPTDASRIAKFLEFRRKRIAQLLERKEIRR